MSKTTRKTYSPQFKMRVALEVAKEQETLSQVAAKHGISPSLAASWRDELLAGADDIFGKARTERERKEQEEAAKRRYDDALKTIGQLTVERDFLQRFCDRNGLGVPPQGGGR